MTAGLRTHMLACVGACFIVIVSAHGFTAMLSARVVLDPSRIAAQVVSGIGCLGAGSIILRNDAIKDLTSAASLWTVAGVGLAAGSGLYASAIASTVIVFVIHAGLKPLKERYRAWRTFLELRHQAGRGEMFVGLLKQVLDGRAARIRQMVVRSSRDAADQDEVAVHLVRVSQRDTTMIIKSLQGSSAVLSESEAEP